MQPLVLLNRPWSEYEREQAREQRRDTLFQTIAFAAYSLACLAAGFALGSILCS